MLDIRSINRKLPLLLPRLHFEFWNLLSFEHYCRHWSQLQEVPHERGLQSMQRSLLHRILRRLHWSEPSLPLIWSINWIMHHLLPRLHSHQRNLQRFNIYSFRSQLQNMERNRLPSMCLRSLFLSKWNLLNRQSSLQILRHDQRRLPLLLWLIWSRGRRLCEEHQSISQRSLLRSVPSRNLHPMFSWLHLPIKWTLRSCQLKLQILWYFDWKMPHLLLRLQSLEWSLCEW